MFNHNNLSVTLDYYDIEVDDRIALSQNFNLTEAERARLTSEGVASADNISTFRFFQNVFDTETRGVDLVTTWSVTTTYGGVTDFSLAWNYNDTEVTEFNADVISAGRIQLLEQALPARRWNFTTVHQKDSWQYMLRANWTDGWFDTGNDITYGDYWVLDAEIRYSCGEDTTLILGGRNFTDKYPDENPFATNTGLLYSESSPLGFNGAFFYGRVIFDF